MANDEIITKNDILYNTAVREIESGKFNEMVDEYWNKRNLECCKPHITPPPKHHPRLDIPSRG